MWCEKTPPPYCSELALVAAAGGLEHVEDVMRNDIAANIMFWLVPLGASVRFGDSADATSRSPA